MHILVPIRSGPDASEVLAFAEQVGARLAAAHPKELTVAHARAARRGRVYLDPFRNAFGQTVVAPYSVRRRARAPISTPLAWDEVRPDLDPADFESWQFSAACPPDRSLAGVLSQPTVAERGRACRRL